MQGKLPLLFSAGRSCSRLPALGLGWKQQKQALQQVCRSLSVSLAQGSLGAFARSRPARSAALPAAPSPGEPLPGGQLRSPRLAGDGGKFKRETSLLTSLRLEWTLL